MTGGILQLVAAGIETLHITGNPNITMFKMTYKPHTEFSQHDVITKLKNINDFGTSTKQKIERHGDLLNKLSIVFDISDIDTKFIEPTAFNIAGLLNDNGIVWNYSEDDFEDNDEVTLDDYNTIIKPIIYDRIFEIVEEYNLYNEYLKLTDEVFEDASDDKTNVLSFEYVYDSSKTIVDNLVDSIDIVMNPATYGPSTTSTTILAKLDTLLEYGPSASVIQAINDLKEYINSFHDFPAPASDTSLILYIEKIYNIMIASDFYQGLTSLQTKLNSVFMASPQLFYKKLKFIGDVFSTVIEFLDVIKEFNTIMSTLLNLSGSLRDLYLFNNDETIQNVLTEFRILMKSNFIDNIKNYLDNSTTDKNLTFFSESIKYLDDEFKNRSDVTVIQTTEFIRDIFEKLIVTIDDDDKREEISELYNGLKNLANDIIRVGGGLESNNVKVYNATDIKNILYNEYLTRILKPTNSSLFTFVNNGSNSDIFIPDTNTEILPDLPYKTVSKLFDNLIFYHTLEFATYNVTADLINTPTRQYFDRIITGAFGSTVVTGLDAYKIYEEYMNVIAGTSQEFLVTTGGLLLTKENLLNNILWNMRRNYKQLEKIVEFLIKQDFENASHFRIGYYKRYQSVSTTAPIYGDTTKFNSLLGSTVSALSDNISTELNLGSLPSEPTTLNQFYTDEVNLRLAELSQSIANEITSQTYDRYFRDFYLWKRGTLEADSDLQYVLTYTNGLYDFVNEDIYTKVRTTIGDLALSQIAVLNYIPILMIRDIPKMVVDYLDSEIRKVIEIGDTELWQLSETELQKVINLFDLRDADQNGRQALFYEADDIDKDANIDWMEETGVGPSNTTPSGRDIYTETVEFKKQLYNSIIQAVLVRIDPTDNTKVIHMDGAYIRASQTNFAPSTTDYIVLPIFRPENTFDIEEDEDIEYQELNNILPAMYVIQMFAKRYYTLIDDFVWASQINSVNPPNGPMEDLRLTLRTTIRNVLDAFTKKTIPSYDTYVRNSYSLYKIDELAREGTTSEINYCDATASIWYKINSKGVSLYNSMMNDYIFSNSNFTSKYGLTMVELFKKYREFVHPADQTSIISKYYENPESESYKPYVASMQYQPLIDDNFPIRGGLQEEPNILTAGIYSTGYEPINVNGSGFDFYSLRLEENASDTPVHYFKISIGNIYTLLNNMFSRYTSFKSILGVKSLLINQKRYQYDRVQEIANFITTQIKTLYNVTDGSALEIIVDDSSTSVISKYDGVKDMIYSTSSPATKTRTSIRQIFDDSEVSNVYDDVNTYGTISVGDDKDQLRYQNLYDWRQTTDGDTIDYYITYFKATSALTEFTPEFIFNTPFRGTLYNDFSTKLDVVHYLIDLLIRQSGELAFLANYLTFPTYVTGYTNLVDFLITNIIDNSKIIDYITKKIGTIEIVPPYRYPEYIYPYSSLSPEPSSDTLIANMYKYINRMKIKNKKMFDELFKSHYDENLLVVEPEEEYNLLYTDSDLDILMTKIIKKEKPQLAFAKELGHRLIENAQIEIDGRIIEEHNSELMSIYNKLYNSKNHKRGYDILIGNTKNNHEITSNKREKQKITVPLNFWFCRDIGNSLPLISTIYSNIFLKLQIAKLNDILYTEKYSTFVRPPKITAKMISRYIFLGTDERNRIARTKNEYLIRKFRYAGTYTTSPSKIPDTNVILRRLYLSNPTQFILWSVKIKYPTTDETDKIDWLYNGYRERDSDGRLTIQKNFIKEMKLKFNGRDRENYKNDKFYKDVIPYSKYLGELDHGEYMYSFSLYPKFHQPSGTANLTHIEDFDILIKLLDGFKTTMTNNKLIFEFKCWSCSYDILRAFSGFIAPAFPE